mgnify:CR=1 FL=1
MKTENTTITYKSDYESLAVFGIPSAEETVDILLRLEKEILA